MPWVCLAGILRDFDHPRGSGDFPSTVVNESAVPATIEMIPAIQGDYFRPLNEDDVTEY
jgi:hypothetical protein